MMIRRYIPLVLLALLSVLQLHGKGYTYECLNSPNRDSQHLLCIHASNRGFVWGGSDRGAYRFGYYDGRWYEPEGREGSIPGAYIYSFFDIPQGTIVMTDGGAALYDGTLDSFQLVSLVDEKGEKSAVTPYSFASASDGTIFAGGDGVLYVYDPDTNTLSVESEGRLPADFRIEAVYEGRGDYLYLVNMEKGAYTYHRKGGFFTEEGLSLTGNVAFCVDSSGYIWRSVGKGLECYDSSISLVATYTTRNSALSSDRITCIIQSGDKLWAGTSYGVNLLDSKTGRITAYARDQHSFASFPCTATVDMTLSSDGSLWTLEPDGSVIVLRESYARTIPVGAVYDNNGHCSDVVLCLSQIAGNNLLWVGTACSGVFTYLYDYDLNDVKVTHIASTDRMRVESMLDLEDGRLLLSCGLDGFYLLDKNSGALSRFDKAPPVPDASVCRDDAGIVMILSDAVYLWNPRSGAVKKVPFGNASQFGHLHPVLDSGGKYFFGDHCICSWDSEREVFTMICNFGEDVTVNDVAYDITEVFWAATDKGLYTYDDLFERSSFCYSPLFSSIESVACDRRGRVWIGSVGSLFVYMPQTESCINVGLSYGVNWNSYIPHSSITTSNSKVIMGGTNGFVTIDTAISFKKTELPEIIVSGFSVNDRIMSVDSPLKLRSFQNNIEVNCFVRESDILRRKSFKFIVSTGGQEEELILGEPHLSLTNLSAGDYVISCCCTLQNGEWSVPVELVSFTINEKWYRSIVFWILVIVFIIVIAFVILRVILHDDKLRRIAEESRHSARLEQENVHFLLNVSHELKTPLTLIISPLTRILKHKSKEDSDYRTLSNVYRQAIRMKTLILTVLDAHKIRSNSAVLNAEPVAFNEWAESLVSDFDEEAEYRGIRIVRRYDSSVSGVSLDAPKLENVITNLLINAMKHSPNDTIISVGTQYFTDRDVVKFYVSDQGEGLGGVDMSKLFDRYYQGMTEKTGSGMGLAYANSIVGLHKGQMGAKDNESGGATFYFEIPAHPL